MSPLRSYLLRLLDDVSLYLAIALGIVYVLAACKAIQPTVAPIATAVLLLAPMAYAFELDRRNKVYVATAAVIYAFGAPIGNHFGLAAACATFVVAFGFWFTAVDRSFNPRSSTLFAAVLEEIRAN